MLSTATMRLLGGRACLDLVNTVDARRDRWGLDLLQSHEDLLVWAKRIALLDADEIAAARAAANEQPEAAADALGRAKRLREAIAGLFEALIAEHDIPGEAMAVFTAEVDAARRCQSLAATDESFAWAWHDENPLARIPHRVALDAAALLMSDTARRRVKLCPGPNCGWLFLDETRNRSRRWCREEGCGTHVRMLRYRAKKR